MLKNITIKDKEKTYFNKDFAASFKDSDALTRVLQDIEKEMDTRGFFEEETIIDMLTIKTICYMVKDMNSLFIALTFDDSIKPDSVSGKLQSFISDIKSAINSGGNIESKCLDMADELNLLRPVKISVVGFGPVGKTSICKVLKGDEPPKTHVPTNVITKMDAKLYNLPITVWDFPVNSNDRLFKNLLLGSDGVILVSDSTAADVGDINKIIQLTDDVIPHAELLIVANKQDVDGAIPANDLASKLKHKVMPFSALDKNQASSLRQQVAYLLELKNAELDDSIENYVINRND